MSSFFSTPWWLSLDLSIVPLMSESLAFDIWIFWFDGCDDQTVAVAIDTREVDGLRHAKCI